VGAELSAVQKITMVLMFEGKAEEAMRLTHRCSPTRRSSP
jgi:predicted 3-demethylubiquinone-9 3-methyltransferase (glyoxalase superfamily)